MSMVHCPHCNATANVSDDMLEPSIECPTCGQQIPFSAASSSLSTSTVPTTSPIAIVAFVLGLPSFIFCLLTAIPALICGTIGLWEIKKSEGRLIGKGWAIAGIVFSILGPIVMSYSFLKAQERSLTSRVRSDMRTMSTALEAYHVDYGVYPPPTGILPITQKTAEKISGVLPLPGNQLTTPIAYMTWIPYDTFKCSNMRMNIFTLAYWPSPRDGWVLASVGPDGHFSIDFETLQKVYDPASTNPMLGLLTYTYDPTNGIKSEGDIFYVKQ
ncbi:TPA: hypothetical protein DDW35_02950 [Candidatus Sumerlaeota bacterium]|jgi:hypothetical protein|nr:hypothetical protein [Candidatus Sumerlaeota bacterium]